MVFEDDDDDESVGAEGEQEHRDVQSDDGVFNIDECVRYHRRVDGEVRLGHFCCLPDSFPLTSLLTEIWKEHEQMSNGRP